MAVTLVSLVATPELVDGSLTAVVGKAGVPVADEDAVPLPLPVIVVDAGLIAVVEWTLAVERLAAVVDFVSPVFVSLVTLKGVVVDELAPVPL